jgi:hypothetical protein
MAYSQAELTPYSENFPRFEEGGNLVFYTHASEPKMQSILTNGIRPRGGLSFPGSYFPDAVSLTAISNLPGSLKVTCNSLLEFIKAKTRYLEANTYDANNFYNFGFALNPKWIKQNILLFKGVGIHLDRERHMDPKSENIMYKLHALSNLPIKLIEKGPKGERPFPAEVHYLGGAIPSTALGGIVIDESSQRFGIAKQLVRNVVHEVKGTGVAIPNVAVYTSFGEMVDII